jgi:hypothetical protein
MIKFGVNYECLPFDLFPTPVTLDDFINNEIEQARESLKFHRKNLRYFRTNLNGIITIDWKIAELVTDSRYHLEMYQDARDELQQNNPMLAEMLLSRKIKKLNKQVNTELYAGRKTCAEDKIKEMNCLRSIKKP